MRCIENSAGVVIVVISKYKDPKVYTSDSIDGMGASNFTVLRILEEDLQGLKESMSNQILPRSASLTTEQGCI